MILSSRIVYKKYMYNNFTDNFNVKTICKVSNSRAYYAIRG